MEQQDVTDQSDVFAFLGDPATQFDHRGRLLNWRFLDTAAALFKGDELQVLVVRESNTDFLSLWNADFDPLEKSYPSLEEAVQALGNSDFPFYNWYLRQTNAAHDIAARNYEFAVRQFERDNGYGVDDLQNYGANSSKYLLNKFAGNMRKWFQINRDNGLPCDLREW
jgi:hypothetical protein